MSSGSRPNPLRRSYRRFVRSMKAIEHIAAEEKALSSRFSLIDETSLFNQRKVLDAFREEMIALRHFALRRATATATRGGTRSAASLRVPSGRSARSPLPCSFRARTPSPSPSSACSCLLTASSASRARPTIPCAASSGGRGTARLKITRYLSRRSPSPKRARSMKRPSAPPFLKNLSNGLHPAFARL